MIMNRRLGKQFCALWMRTKAAAVIFLAAAGMIPSAASCTWALDQNGMQEKNCSVTILYLDEQENEQNGQGDPVAGAVFSFYKIAETGDLGSVSKSLFPDLTVNAETDPSAIAGVIQEAYSSGPFPEKGSMYTARTGADGIAVCREMEQGVYLAVETKPAEKHFASIPFLIMLPGTSEDGTSLEYDRQAEPKPLPAGSLKISKHVRGSEGEKNREFHFTVRFSGADEAVLPASWHYRHSSGTEGELKNGGTVALKDGESLQIEMIPVGTAYTTEETEAGKDGYHTEVSGASGVIRRTVLSEAVFTNSKEAPAKTQNTQNIQTGDSFWLIAAAAIVTAVLVAGKTILQKCRRGGNRK